MYTQNIEINVLHWGRGHIQVLLFVRRYSVLATRLTRILAVVLPKVF